MHVSCVRVNPGAVGFLNKSLLSQDSLGLCLPELELAVSGHNHCVLLNTSHQSSSAGESGVLNEGERDPFLVWFWMWLVLPDPCSAGGGARYRQRVWCRVALKRRSF